MSDQTPSVTAKVRELLISGALQEDTQQTTRGDEDLQDLDTENYQRIRQRRRRSSHF